MGTSRAAPVFFGLLLAVSTAGAQSPESFRAAADRAFADALSSPFSPRPPKASAKFVGPFPEKTKSRVAKLEPVPLGPQRLGEALAKVSLEKNLDALRKAGPVSIGGREFTVGLAADAEFKYFFLTFTGGGGASLDPLVRGKDFLGDGTTLDLPGGATFRVSLSLKLTDPVRSSRVELTPLSGGEPTALKTGDFLGLLEDKAVSIELDGKQYYLAYLSDVDPVSARPTGTRSFLIFKENRFIPKAWRLPASDLPEGAPVSVGFDDEELVLLKDASGDLSLYSR